MLGDKPLGVAFVAPFLIRSGRPLWDGFIIIVFSTDITGRGSAALSPGYSYLEGIFLIHFSVLPCFVTELTL